jgi:hypothetical protein
MGQKANSNLFAGARTCGQTTGSSNDGNGDKSIADISSSDGFIVRLIADPILIDQVRARGDKISEKDVIFATKDRRGEIVWLEQGAYRHMIKRNHDQQMAEKHHFKKKDFVSHLYKVFRYGAIYDRQLVDVPAGNGTRKGWQIIYRYRGKYYMIGSLGTNGYIQSAYPIDKEEAAAIRSNNHGKE